jgi:hypothetical protein
MIGSEVDEVSRVDVGLSLIVGQEGGRNSQQSTSYESRDRAVPRNDAA